LNGLDYCDARLGRDDWSRYAGHLGAVEGRRARLLRIKIEAALSIVPSSEGDALVLALTRSDRALLHELDQQELDALSDALPGALLGGLLVRPGPGEAPAAAPAPTTGELPAQDR